MGRVRWMLVNRSLKPCGTRVIICQGAFEIGEIITYKQENFPLITKENIQNGGVFLAMKMSLKTAEHGYVSKHPNHDLLEF
jgi:hypothetical protein